MTLENNFYLLEQKELSLDLRDVSKSIQTPCLMYNTYHVVNYIITKQQAGQKQSTISNMLSLIIWSVFFTDNYVVSTKK